MRFITLASPPTPNGSLHLGHIAGPYIAADVFSKWNFINSNETIFVSGIDGYLNYVFSQAKLMNTTPKLVVKHFSKEIHNTLESLSISIDSMSLPNKEKDNFNNNFFQTLLKKGKLEIRETENYFCLECNKYLIDSFITGKCPTCYNETKGNICEICGHPNATIDLIESHCSVDKSHSITKKKLKRLFFPLSNYANKLEDFYLKDSKCELRPRIRKLARELINKGLDDIPISQPGEWGNKVLIPELQGQIYNSWAEILPSFLYDLTLYSEKSLEDILKKNDTKLIIFFGYDNSFFFLMLHLAMLMAHTPGTIKYSALICNEFLLLNNKKFSTSRKNAIWADEFVRQYHSDYTRAFLCFINPEYHQSNFDEQRFIEFSNSLEHKLFEISDKIQFLQQFLIKTEEQEQYKLDDNFISQLENFIQKFSISAQYEFFSLREIYNNFNIYIEWFTIQLNDLMVVTVNSANSSLIKVKLGKIIMLFSILAYPIMPKMALDIANIFKIPLDFQSFRNFDISELVKIDFNLLAKKIRVLHS